METAVTANRRNTDVLIVGAGPTGLALATMLMRSGITPVIIDKLTRGQNTSRAVVIHSLVRQTAGIRFTGGSYEESFVLADVEMIWDHGRDEVMLFFSPAGLLVVAPLPGG